MYQQQFCNITFFLTIFFIINCFNCAPNSDVDNNDNNIVVVKEVPFGKTVVLNCRSNDKKHNFIFWQNEQNGVIIGPQNANYDKVKYRYEILSGNLTIKAVTDKDEGLYQCVSIGVKDDNFNIRKVRLVVQPDWEKSYETSSEVNSVRILTIIIIVLILCGASFGAYKIWKDRYRYPHYLAQVEDDDDDSAEELFSAPGPSTSKGGGGGGGGKSRLESPSIYSSRNSHGEFENVSISTDFNSILDAAK